MGKGEGGGDGGEEGGEAGHVPPRLGGQGHQLVGDTAQALFILEDSELIELINNSRKHNICIYIFIYLIVVNKNVS